MKYLGFVSDAAQAMTGQDNPPMQSRASVQTPGPVWPARLSRLATRWWRRLPPSRQDRLATIGPLVSVLLFLAAITSAFWYLRQEEISRELESVVRDTEITQQRVGLRLIENQEQLVRLARELISREISNAEFSQQARTLTTDRHQMSVDGIDKIDFLHH